MSSTAKDLQERKLDQAARAAWFYYIAGNTQEEVAAKLNVSRQTAQRLVSIAVSEKLIKFRLDHPIAACVELEERIREHFELDICTIVPTAESNSDSSGGVALALAERIEASLSVREPTIIGISTGRTLLAAVAEVPTMNQPEHKIVSLIGAMSRDGRASHYEVVSRLSDRTNAQCYPMPTPVVTSTVEERILLQSQRSYQTILSLAEKASACFVGVCEIAWNCPLQRDGFLTESEVVELADRGAVGEIAGWAFNAAGQIIEGSTNLRVAGVPLRTMADLPIVAAGSGIHKVQAVRAALRGKLIKGLITDMATGSALLAGTPEI
ncbi:sugar-binding transcriptional regulator [Pleomorphomonas carboxyditropha]|uniref:DNA-binding transcriptional regulator n=1 Tax=Pleomorphomonas carboxyditropha TaxID=2023338 RepID=A0A2G9WZI4_9HYPH|nr:sugar-binding transcriptional regulator [Pleomorphomonas carboxyditropha]PIP00122.1 DNA-binding transcriptional regulator [Pleomorphomonas carboxyditropha]